MLSSDVAVGEEEVDDEVEEEPIYELADVPAHEAQTPTQDAGLEPAIAFMRVRFS